MGPLALVAALIASGFSAPFAHTHAHGPDPGAPPAPGSDAHCDQHPRHGAHWHLSDATADDAPRSPKVAGTHRHPAVSVDTGAVTPHPPNVAAPLAVVRARHATVGPDPDGAPTAAAVADGPDPPPRTAVSARAPPPPR